MLYWNTVSSLLKDCLLTLTDAEELEDFRLVGGTALSLYLGHRLSVDIDLFTDANYGSVDFDAIEVFLKRSFGYVDGDFGRNPGMGKSYLVRTDQENAIKLDLYYSMDPFFQSVFQEGDIRMATIEEIIAMEIDVIQRGGRKKDFWDLHELLNQYNVTAMVKLHKKRFEWTHDEHLIINNFIDFSEADNDLDPICLKNKQWAFIKEDIETAVSGR